MATKSPSDMVSETFSSAQKVRPSGRLKLRVRFWISMAADICLRCVGPAPTLSVSRRRGVHDTRQELSGDNRHPVGRRPLAVRAVTRVWKNVSFCVGDAPPDFVELARLGARIARSVNDERGRLQIAKPPVVEIGV